MFTGDSIMVIVAVWVGFFGFTTNRQTSAASIFQQLNKVHLNSHPGFLLHFRNARHVNDLCVFLQVSQGSWIFETDNDQQVSSWTTEIKECINNR